MEHTQDDQGRLAQRHACAAVVYMKVVMLVRADQCIFAALQQVLLQNYRLPYRSVAVVAGFAPMHQCN